MWRQAFRRVALALAVAVAVIPPHVARADDWTACDAAGEQAEAAHQLPPGMLAAIGRVESGRSVSGTSRVAPWPWTINAAGKGQSFADRATALAATRTLLDQGVASIDVGCFQINLAFHPDAFNTLEEGFEPRANATAAARFLGALRARLGNWDGAIAAYHSAVPERGNPYRLRVLAQWAHPGMPATDLPALPDEFAVPVLRELSWSPATKGMQVWSPSGRNAAPNVISMQPVAALPLIRTAASSNR